MNLFILDEDVTISAQYHLDSHVVKMPSEIEQMIAANARHLIGVEKQGVLLLPGEELFINDRGRPDIIPESKRMSKLSHVNHPCTIWGRADWANFLYMVRLATALEEEWRFRWDHTPEEVHASVEKIRRFCASPDFLHLMKAIPYNPVRKGFGFAQAMPDEYRHDCAITAYRQLYARGKTHLHAWKKRGEPKWLREY